MNTNDLIIYLLYFIYLFIIIIIIIILFIYLFIYIMLLLLLFVLVIFFDILSLLFLSSEVYRTWFKKQKQNKNILRK